MGFGRAQPQPVTEPLPKGVAWRGVPLPAIVAKTGAKLRFRTSPWQLSALGRLYLRARKAALSKSSVAVIVNKTLGIMHPQ